MSASTNPGLRRARQAVLDAHSAAENAHDLDGVIATSTTRATRSSRPARCSTARRRCGATTARTSRGVPDFTVEPIAAHHGDDAVAEEAWVSGTHLGTYNGLPPTGRFVRIRACGIFVFEEDRLVCERVYYDLLTVLRELGVARDPDSVAGQVTMVLNHPLHLGRTFGRELLRRRRGGSG